MFTVYHSNQIDILKSLLVELVRLQPLDNPFDKEHILVQSPGMSQWLKMALAKEFGVAANIEFPLPATYIWDMFTQVLPEVPKRSAFNKEAMTWKLMHILPKHLEQEEFQPLKAYLDGDDDSSKLYQLAEKIADIFDGYLVYRPEWIASWESGKEVEELEGEHPWQPILWQSLYDYTLELGQSPYHRANLYEDFIDTLSHYTGSFEHLPQRLFVFGITSLPPRYMDALKAIGEHIDVHLMFANPCRYYWGDVRDKRFLAKLASKQRQHVEWHGDHSEYCGDSHQLKQEQAEHLYEEELHTDVVGNSLLASMGKLGRDNMFLLSQLDSHEVEAFVDVERDSLLHHLQADILGLEEHQDDDILDSSYHKQKVSAEDRSLTFHACHSPMREVEVLHDQLLAMFDANHALKPRDIIVMVSDINAYSPAIQAVFGNAPGERYIPYSISDRTADQESPILAAFMQLVRLPESRCLASELLELLELPAIMARFDIDETQFEQAKQWVEEAGIRWGLNGQTASEFDLPHTNQNTWQFGIERMLLGYAMSDSVGLFEAGQHSNAEPSLNAEPNPIAAYNEVQGGSAELAGKLAHFIDRVGYFRNKLAQTQSIDAWREVLHDLLDEFFLVEVEGELALKSIRDALTQLNDQLNDAGYTEALAPRIIHQYLQNKLSGTRISQRFLAGQVNFCTLMPMRSIPFKTVCLLGMNDGVYPRTVPPEGFDLMNGRTKAGDRSRRDDDRYLFLEAILSAQEVLYVSYVGRSIQDNSERVPSVLVSELVEYCQQNYCLIDDESLGSDESGERLTTSLFSHHAMTPFSPSAFVPLPNGELSSYAKEWLPAANRKGEKGGEFNRALTDYLQDATYPLELELTELQRFWRLPVQYFFNRRLKVMFEPPLSVLEDDEPFVLTGLESYQLKEELLDLLLDLDPNGQESDVVVQTLTQQHRAQGKLPIGAFGDIESESSHQKVKLLVDEIQFMTQSPQDDIEIMIELDVLGTNKPVRLVGWLTHHYQSGLVRYRSGQVRSQDYLAAWIDHLCLAVVGMSKPTYLIGFDKKKGVEHYRFDAIDSVDHAKSLLGELVRLFYQGMTQPLAYFPKTALAAIESGFSRGDWVEDEEKAHQKMANTFNDSYAFSGEGNNDYIARIWPEWNDELAVESYHYASLVLQGARLAAKEKSEVEPE